MGRKSSIIWAALLVGLGYLLHLPLRLAEDRLLEWMNKKLDENWQGWLVPPLEFLLGWVVPIIMAGILLWLAYLVARQSLLRQTRPQQEIEDDRRYSQNDVIFWLKQALPLTMVGKTEQAPLVATQGAVALGQGAVTLAGGNTTEASTTSTWPVDLSGVAGLGVEPVTPFLVIARFRRTIGTISVGLKLNEMLVAPETRINIPGDVEEIDVVWYVGGVISENRRAVFMSAPRLEVSESVVGERPRERITSAVVRGAAASPDAMVAVEYVAVFELPQAMQ